MSKALIDTASDGGAQNDRSRALIFLDPRERQYSINKPDKSNEPDKDDGRGYDARRAGPQGSDKRMQHVIGITAIPKVALIEHVLPGARTPDH